MATSTNPFDLITDAEFFCEMYENRAKVEPFGPIPTESLHRAFLKAYAELASPETTRKEQSAFWADVYSPETIMHIHALYNTPLPVAKPYHPGPLLNAEIAQQIREEIRSGKKTVALAKKYGVSNATICNIKSNKTYTE